MTIQVISLTSLIFAIIGTILGITSLVMIIGLKNSTHSVQWVPIDEKDALDSKKLEEKLNKPYQDLEDMEEI